MSSTIATPLGVSVPDNWIPLEDAHTSDDLINAYLRGKEEGRKENERILLEHIRIQIAKTQRIAESVFEIAKGAKLTLKTMYLKAEDAARYKVLFVAKEKDFLNPEFRQLYIAARQLAQQEEAENFHFAFSFLPVPSKHDAGCILSNGYFLEYGQGTKARPRKA